MRLQLPWGFPSLHTTAANSLCQEDSPVPHLPQSLLFQVVCIFGNPPCLKRKAIGASTRATCFVFVLMVMP